MKQVRIIIPFIAGSQTNVLARAIGVRLSESSGQQVVVDNRSSAGGIVAGGILVNAPPDGYTVMLTSNAFAVSAALYNRRPYDRASRLIDRAAPALHRHAAGDKRVRR